MEPTEKPGRPRYIAGKYLMPHFGYKRETCRASIPGGWRRGRIRYIAALSALPCMTDEEILESFTNYFRPWPPA